MPKKDSEGTNILRSFIFGLIFIVIIIFIFGSIFMTKVSFFEKLNMKNEISKVTSPTPAKPLISHNDINYSISFPEDYQIHLNKIVATEGIIENKKNTIHLISPPLNDLGGNMSIIFSYQPYTTFQEESNLGSTCAELDDLELKPLTLGNNKFTYSGLINCGPNVVAFFYILNGGNIYEAKVETTADYKSDALPEVLKILEKIKFNQ